MTERLEQPADEPLSPWEEAVVFMLREAARLRREREATERAGAGRTIGETQSLETRPRRDAA